MGILAYFNVQEFMNNNDDLRGHFHSWKNIKRHEVTALSSKLKFKTFTIQNILYFLSPDKILGEVIQALQI